MLAAFVRKQTLGSLRLANTITLAQQKTHLSQRFLSQKIDKWLPWEDTLLRNYVKHNGKKWNELVQHCLPNKTPGQCQQRWADTLDPKIKQGPFSRAEKELLKQGVEALGKGNWTAISKEYLPHRSSRRIANEWSSMPSATTTAENTITKPSKRRRWTKEEDELLLKGIAELGSSSWADISAQYLPWRTRVQIRNHYRSNLDPSVKKEKWTEHELDLLLRRTIIFGQDWSRVADGIHGRTPEQCRQVWLSDLDPALNKGPWSDEETRLFWERLHQCDGNFVKVAEELQGRNRLACFHKFWSTVRHDKEFTFFYGDQIKKDKTENGPVWRARVAKLVCEWLSRETSIREAPNHSIHVHQAGSWDESELERLESLVNKQLDKKKTLGQEDWRSIAKHFTARNARQCKYQYEEHVLNKNVKKGAWTEEEDKLLKDLISEYGTSEWDEIVKRIPNRNKRQCAYRWNRVLRFADVAKNKRFSEDEKALIREGVEMFGNNWAAIRMTYLPHRTPEQIMRWWNAHQKNSNSDGRNSWTAEEDKTLKFAVSKYADEQGQVSSWAQVAKLVQERTPKQCRTRWLYSLQPNINRDAWTYDEEMQLLEIVQKHKLQKATSEKSIWPQVAKELNTGRSDWACRLKYSYMQRKGHRFAF